MKKEEQSAANTGWISAYSRYLCWLIVTWRPKVRRAGSNPGDKCLLHWHILCKFPHLSRIFKSRKYSPQIAFSKCFKTKSEKKIIVKIFKAKKNPAALFKTHIFTTCCERAIYMFFNVRCWFGILWSEFYVQLIYLGWEMPDLKTSKINEWSCVDYGHEIFASCRYLTKINS